MGLLCPLLPIFEVCMQQFFKALKFVDTHFEEVLCFIGISCIAICVFLQFMIRLTLGSALAWPEEIAIYGMAWSMFLGACLCVRQKAHMRILLLIKKLPRKIGLSLLVFGDILWFFFCIFMCLVGVEYIKQLLEYTMISPSLEIDQAYPQSIIPFAFGLMAFRILQLYYTWFREGCPDLPA